MIQVPPNKICQQLWESGFALMDFLIACGDPDLTDRYRAGCSELLADGNASGTLEDVLRVASNYSDMDIRYLEHRHCIIDYHPDGHWKDDDPIFELIQARRLVGFGFIYPREPQHFPRPIPMDVWSRDANAWENSVSGNGIGFVGVRLAPVSKFEALMRKFEGRETSRTVGRPTVRNEVLEAFQILYEAGQIDPDKPLSQAYQLIRDWLSDAYPENADRFAKLAGETIRRVISDDFKSLSTDKKL